MRSKQFLRALQLLAIVSAAALLLGHAGTAPASEGAVGPSAYNWNIIKFPQGQPGCTGVGLTFAYYFDRLDCGFGQVTVSETTSGSVVNVDFVGPDGTIVATERATFRSDLSRTPAPQVWQFSITPSSSWPAGEIKARVRVGDGPTAGEEIFFLNELGASVSPKPKADGSAYHAGEPLTVVGRLFELDSVTRTVANRTDVAGQFFLRVVKPNGETSDLYGPFTANAGGTAGNIDASVPGEATQGLTATAATQFKTTVAVEVVRASFSDLLTGGWVGERAGAASVTYSIPPDHLVVENSFVSSVGWVKPGQTYPFRVFVKNFTPTAASDASVSVASADGTTFLKATPTTGSGTAKVKPDGSISWSVGNVPAATAAGPATATLVVEARADSLQDDPQIVWKDLSTTATLSYRGGPAGLTSESHGPKVIPPKATYNGARYGDRPFPVVPVDYFDRKHEQAHTGERLSSVINSKDVKGSTFNLYQEMSYGQLFPSGTVPSAALQSAGWDVSWNSARYRDGGFQFTSLQPQGTCKGATFKDFKGTDLYPERIANGWYQLPGDTEYYGGDRFGSALPGALVGIGLLLDIDSACGPTGKAVYDAAHIADPEVDYSDYDTDKDGVVDFFMMVFVGAGGNGVSQTSAPPYDNIWPHSSSLEFYFTDPATGQKGYVSDDQLKDHSGRPLFYTDGSRRQMTTSATEYPVYVRVGPYNVNPESAVERASVISHEYGHSLGLPDFYSLGSRATYGDWNLMATDKSQHMDVYAKQELGWLVPRVLGPGETTVSGWRDSKVNTHRIDWRQPDGTPYTLSGPGVDNGEAYVAKLPPRKIIQASEVPSGDHVWWSQSGNNFGCAPDAGHNLDIFLGTLPPGETITLRFKSRWDIEWDFDYGFVMISTDGGGSYTALPSQKGFSTDKSFNPNASSCLSQFGHGLTGTSGSYAAGTQTVDRLEGNYPAGGFLSDEYDLSSAAGEETVLRFSYATDPGLARPAWFIDDLEVATGSGQVIYGTDFETSGGPDDPRVFNGGCKDQLRVAATCTEGWQYVSASEGSPKDHAYFLELRDRSGFDFDGNGQNDRTPIAFAPGLLLVYADEQHGRGNVGTADPPAQTPLDSQPQPRNQTPDLNDAAFTAAAGDSHFDDDSGDGRPWVDNYRDPRRPPEVVVGVAGEPILTQTARWTIDFNCLTFDVLAMSGDQVGPNTAPGDLTANVRFRLASGCFPFDYGHGDVTANAAPTAVAQAKPLVTTVGKRVQFDGGGSFDDNDTPRQLSYRWSFGDGATATGQRARHAYASPGTYTATLTVTDTAGKSDTDSVVIRVTG